MTRFFSKKALIGLIALALLVVGLGSLFDKAKEQIYFDIWLSMINQHRLEDRVFQQKLESAVSFQLKDGGKIEIGNIRLLRAEYNPKKYELKVYVWGDYISGGYAKPIQLSDIKESERAGINTSISLSILESPIVINGQIRKGEFFKKKLKKIAIYFSTPFPEEEVDFKQEGMFFPLEYGG